jgi:hypothetical protein
VVRPPGRGDGVAPDADDAGDDADVEPRLLEPRPLLDMGLQKGAVAAGEIGRARRDGAGDLEAV